MSNQEMFHQCSIFTKFAVNGTRWHSWLRHCAISRKVAASIPDGVLGFFIDLIFPAALCPLDRLNF
jgi:hypothetical protein